MTVGAVAWCGRGAGGFGSTGVASEAKVGME
jgi:dUTPase